MLKIAGLIIVILLLGAYQASQPGNENEHFNKASSLKSHKYQESQSEAPTVSQQETLYATASEQEHQGQTATRTETPHDWVDRLNAASTSVIAVFTVLLFVAVIWQTKTTRNLERAWLVASLDWFAKGRVQLRLSESSTTELGVSAESISMTLKITCKNYGRSLARVDEILGRIDIAAKADRGRPDESSLMHLGKMEAIPPNSESSVGIQMNCEGHPKKDENIFAYVLVNYRDIFGKRRKVSMGYAIDSYNNIYRQDGLPIRNINT